MYFIRISNGRNRFKDRKTFFGRIIQSGAGGGIWRRSVAFSLSEICFETQNRQKIHQLYVIADQMIRRVMGSKEEREKSMISRGFHFESNEVFFEWHPRSRIEVANRVADRFEKHQKTGCGPHEEPFRDSDGSFYQATDSKDAKGILPQAGLDREDAMR